MTEQEFIPTSETERSYAQATHWSADRCRRWVELNLKANRVELAIGQQIALCCTHLKKRTNSLEIDLARLLSLLEGASDECKCSAVKLIDHAINQSCSRDLSSSSESTKKILDAAVAIALTVTSPPGRLTVTRVLDRYSNTEEHATVILELRIDKILAVKSADENFDADESMLARWHRQVLEGSYDEAKQTLKSLLEESQKAMSLISDLVDLSLLLLNEDQTPSTNEQLSFLKKTEPQHFDLMYDELCESLEASEIGTFKEELVCRISALAYTLERCDRITEHSHVLRKAIDIRLSGNLINENLLKDLEVYFAQISEVYDIKDSMTLCSEILKRAKDAPNHHASQKISSLSQQKSNQLTRAEEAVQRFTNRVTQIKSNSVEYLDALTSMTVGLSSAGLTRRAQALYPDLWTTFKKLQKTSDDSYQRASEFFSNAVRQLVPADSQAESQLLMPFLESLKENNSRVRAWDTILSNLVYAQYSDRTTGERIYNELLKSVETRVGLEDQTLISFFDVAFNRARTNGNHQECIEVGQKTMHITRSAWVQAPESKVAFDIHRDRLIRMLTLYDQIDLKEQSINISQELLDMLKDGSDQTTTHSNCAILQQLWQHLQHVYPAVEPVSMRLLQEKHSHCASFSPDKYQHINKTSGTKRELLEAYLTELTETVNELGSETKTSSEQASLKKMLASIVGQKGEKERAEQLFREAQSMENKLENHAQFELLQFYLSQRMESEADAEFKRLFTNTSSENWTEERTISLIFALQNLQHSNNSEMLVRWIREIAPHCRTDNLITRLDNLIEPLMRKLEAQVDKQFYKALLLARLGSETASLPYKMKLSDLYAEEGDWKRSNELFEEARLSMERAGHSTELINSYRAQLKKRLSFNIQANSESNASASDTARSADASPPLKISFALFATNRVLIEHNSQIVEYRSSESSLLRRNSCLVDLQTVPKGRANVGSLGTVQILHNGRINGYVSELTKESPQIPKLPIAPPSFTSEPLRPPPHPMRPPPPPMMPNRFRKTKYPDDVSAAEYALPQIEPPDDITMINTINFGAVVTGGNFFVDANTLSKMTVAHESKSITKLFVMPTAGEKIVLKTQRSSSYSPLKLQIYCEGTNEIRIEHQFIGVIYAPRAKIVITANSTLYGAVVAEEIICSGNSMVLFDLDLLGVTL